MIDAKGKVLKFGYGDIGVGADSINFQITFQQFKPPSKCGTYTTGKEKYVGKKICITLTYQTYCELMEHLERVKSKEITKFIFKGYTFDFTNYDKESIRVCQRQARATMARIILSMAS